MKPDSEPRAAARRVKALARAAGFELVRIADASPLHRERAQSLQWLHAGRAAEMRWITPEHIHRSAEPSAVLTEARSVISLGLSYWSGHRAEFADTDGLVARYAWGDDYHRVLGVMLKDVMQSLQAAWGGEHRCFVDTGPVSEKAHAARSGLGWYGKNTNILTDRFGSYVLLGEIVTSLSLEADKPLHRTCGSCRLCTVACPTGALDDEYSIDSRKCISYLTIEHRGPIPRELRSAMGAWVYGCDICQDVCPPTMQSHLSSERDRKSWAVGVRRIVKNSQSAFGMPNAESIPTPLNSGTGRQTVDLEWLLTLQHADYLDTFRHSSVRRAKVWMLRRNAAIALGNVGNQGAIMPLANALNQDENTLVRGHAAWALGQIGARVPASEVGPILAAALDVEADAYVREELTTALDYIGDPRRVRGISMDGTSPSIEVNSHR